MVYIAEIMHIYPIILAFLELKFILHVGLEMLHEDPSGAERKEQAATGSKLAVCTVESLLTRSSLPNMAS